MVLILDGNSENFAPAWQIIGLYGEKISDLWLLQIQSNALDISNNWECSVRESSHISYMGFSLYFDLENIFTKVNFERKANWFWSTVLLNSSRRQAHTQVFRRGSRILLKVKHYESVKRGTPSTPSQEAVFGHSKCYKCSGDILPPLEVLGGATPCVCHCLQLWAKHIDKSNSSKILRSGGLVSYPPCNDH